VGAEVAAARAEGPTSLPVCLPALVAPFRDSFSAFLQTETSNPDGIICNDGSGIPITSFGSRADLLRYPEPPVPPCYGGGAFLVSAGA